MDPDADDEAIAKAAGEAYVLRHFKPIAGWFIVGALIFIAAICYSLPRSDYLIVGFCTFLLIVTVVYLPTFYIAIPFAAVRAVRRGAIQDISITPDVLRYRMAGTPVVVQWRQVKDVWDYPSFIVLELLPHGFAWFPKRTLPPGLLDQIPSVASLRRRDRDLEPDPLHRAGGATGLIRGALKSKGKFFALAQLLFGLPMAIIFLATLGREGDYGQWMVVIALGSVGAVMWAALMWPYVRYRFGNTTARSDADS